MVSILQKGRIKRALGTKQIFSSLGIFGYRVVTAGKALASEFEMENSLLSNQPLDQPNIERNAEDSSKAGLFVGLDWQS